MARALRFLHHKIAGEAAGRLDDNRPHAVALDPFQHGRKARTNLDRISPGDGGVIVVADKLIPVSLGECFDSYPLTALAVLIRADVRRRACPQIRNRRDFCFV